jgi:hypothetical protein
MKYKLSEQELKDLMHRSWLKAKKFYKGQTDEYFYDHFENEKKQLTIHNVVVPKGTLCYCGGNERVALDCTMKPCKHPKYFKG